MTDPHSHSRIEPRRPTVRLSDITVASVPQLHSKRRGNVEWGALVHIPTGYVLASDIQAFGMMGAYSLAWNTDNHVEPFRMETPRGVWDPWARERLGDEAPVGAEFTALADFVLSDEEDRWVYVAGDRETEAARHFVRESLARKWMRFFTKGQRNYNRADWWRQTGDKIVLEHNRFGDVSGPLRPTPELLFRSRPAARDVS